MTAKQYGILLDLFNEMNAEFQRLSDETKDEFMAILYGHKTLNRETGRYERSSWIRSRDCDLSRSKP